MIPLYAIAALSIALTVAGGWIWHLRGEQGAARAQMEQLQAVNTAALAAAGRLTQENQRLDATLAARGRTGAAIDTRAADSRRRLADALQDAPEWADSPVPPVIGGLLADNPRDPDRGHPGPAAAGADGGPPGAGVPGGP